MSETKNHKWKDNICVHCGLARTKRGWKLLMAIESGKDYYQYGTAWYYGKPHEDMKTLIRGIGFARPNCKREKNFYQIKATP